MIHKVKLAIGIWTLLQRQEHLRESLGQLLWWFPTFMFWRSLLVIQGIYKIVLKPLFILFYMLVLSLIDNLSKVIQLRLKHVALSILHNHLLYLLDRVQSALTLLRVLHGGQQLLAHL